MLEQEYLEIKKGDLVEIIKGVNGSSNSNIGKKAVIVRKGATNFLWIKLLDEERELCCPKSRLKRIIQT